MTIKFLSQQSPHPKKVIGHTLCIYILVYMDLNMSAWTIEGPLYVRSLTKITKMKCRRFGNNTGQDLKRFIIYYMIVCSLLIL